MKLPCCLLIGLSIFQGGSSFQPTLLHSCALHKTPAKLIGFSPARTPHSHRPPTLSHSSKCKSYALNIVAGATAPLTVAAKSGLVAVAVQFVLAKFVFPNKKCPQVLQDTAEYTAHSVVALGLMILLSGLGVWGWWWNPSSISGAARILDVSATGHWMAAVVLGCFSLWDIPVSVKVKALRKPDVIAHHCVMTLVAAMGCFLLPMEYVLYYFGIVELSSIPLIFYDQTAHWVENMKQNQEDDQPHALEKIQGNLGIVAGVAFTLIRVVSFTKVTFRGFLPDCMKALATSSSEPQKWAIRFLMFACGGFTFLQWYWFSNMIKAFKEGGV
jgi:TLC domain